MLTTAMFVFSVLELIFKIFGFDLKRVIKEKEKRDEIERFYNKDQQYEKITREGLITRALSEYYSNQDLKLGNLNRYVFTIDGSSIDTTIATKPDWIELGIKLESENVLYDLGSEVAYMKKQHRENGENYDKYLKYLNVALWDSKIYRLVDFDRSGKTIKIKLALDTFFNYRYKSGLLYDELMQALLDANLEVEALISHRKEYLPLREQFLPNGNSLVNFSKRVCAGGVSVLFAIAHPRQNDFLILVKQRSNKTIDCRRMLCVVPKAFHQPMIDFEIESDLSLTVFREVYEELFGGEETERDVKREDPKWYFRECEALKWFLDNKDSYDLECTSFGIDLVSGNYEFAILLAVHDVEYWNKFGSLMKTNWELLSDVNPSVHSRDREQLSELAQKSDWTGEGLVAFVEGLRRLKVLEPKKVHLPNITTFVE